MKRYKRIFENMHCFVQEAVVHTESYLYNINNELNKIDKKVFSLNSSSEICKFLSDYLYSYNISFDILESKIIKYGVVKGRTFDNLNIVVYCSENMNDYFKSKDSYNLFKESVLLVLAHELVHRGQYMQMKKQAHIGNDIKITDKNDLKYYRKKDEIMSFANMIIEELRFNGYNNDEIIYGIKYNSFDQEDCDFLKFYRINFINEKQILNQLYKYMYEYLKGTIKIVLK